MIGFQYLPGPLADNDAASHGVAGCYARHDGSIGAISSLRKKHLKAKSDQVPRRIFAYASRARGLRAASSGSRSSQPGTDISLALPPMSFGIQGATPP